MKNLLVILLILVIGSTAFALTGYECRDDSGTEYLLLPRNYESAKIFVKTPGETKYKSLFSNAQFQESRRDATFIGQNTSKVNWNKVKGCYVNKGIGYYFEIKNGLKAKGTLETWNQIAINPKTYCNTPPKTSRFSQLSCARVSRE